MAYCTSHSTQNNKSSLHKKYCSLTECIVLTCSKRGFLWNFTEFRMLWTINFVLQSNSAYHRVRQWQRSHKISLWFPKDSLTKLRSSHWCTQGYLGWTLYFRESWLWTFNSLWPGDAIWWHKSGSTLAIVMVCCGLVAPCHHLNQCWFLCSIPRGQLLGAN